MRWALLAAAAMPLVVSGCGGGNAGQARESAAPDARREVTRLARDYYDAFRERRLNDACGLVAQRLLPMRLIVGFTTPGGDMPDVRPTQQPRDGCAEVRQRRRKWTEPIPRSAWEVEQVVLDPAAERARVDTSAEGTYWMRRLCNGWRIVGFGSLTDEAAREFGGDWAQLNR